MFTDNAMTSSCCYSSQHDGSIMIAYSLIQVTVEQVAEFLRY